jgi:DNA polymerase III subunit gamma/tau
MFEFYKLKIAEILKKLEKIVKEEKIDIQHEALIEIARLASGSMRDAESLLDQVFTLFGKRKINVKDIRNLLGLVPTQLAIEFFDFLIKRDAKGGINFLNQIEEKGIDLEEFAKNFVDYLRKVLIFKITNSTDDEIFSALSKEELEKLKEQSLKVNEIELKKILSLFLDAQNKMRFSPILQLPLELAIVETCSK